MEQGEKNFFRTRTGDIYKILAKEAESFYAGYKTAEEVCRIIQSRVYLLINEN